MKKRAFTALISVSLGLAVAPIRARAGDEPKGVPLVSVERFFDRKGRQNCRRFLMRSAVSGSELTELVTESGMILRKNPRNPRRTASNDRFALTIMAKRKVISEKAAEFYGGETGLIESAQMTNIETVEKITESEFRKGADVDASYSEGALSGYVYHVSFKDQSITPHVLNRKATFRVTSGQLPFRGGYVHKPLPWALEYFPDAPRRAIDRKKYKYVWEFGRAAQRESGLTENGRALAAILALRELDAVGGALDEAFVFVHAPKKANADLYRRWGFERHSLPAAGAEDEILVIPLRKIVEDPRTWRNIRSIQDLARGMPEPIDFPALVRVYDRLVADRIVEFGLEGAPFPKGTTLSLHDYTDYPTEILARRLVESGVKTADVGRIAEHAKRLTVVHGETAHDLPNFSSVMGLASGKYRYPEVEIGGLSGPLGHEKDTLAAALIAALTMYRNQLLDLGVTGPERRVRSMTFMIRGKNLEALKRNLKSLGIPSTAMRVNTQDLPINSVYIAGDDLVAFEERTPSLAGNVLVDLLDRTRERTFAAPLNL